MRFPKIPLMDRTFNLFERLNIPRIPYYLSTPHDVKLFNGYLFKGTPPEKDPFHVSTSNGGNVPDSWESQGYGNLIEAKFGPFKQALATDFDKGWKQLMQFDNYSTRMYMSSIDPKYPTPVSVSQVAAYAVSHVTDHWGPIGHRLVGDHGFGHRFIQLCTLRRRHGLSRFRLSHGTARDGKMVLHPVSLTAENDSFQRHH